MTSAHPFYMIRHGETDWNVERRFQGQQDIPVNERGRRQSAAYAEMLKAERDDWDGWHFVASPLSRTRVTMEIMRTGLGLDPMDYALDDDLKEVTFGQWERFKLDELAPRFPELVAQRKANRWNFVAPGGESYAAASQRVKQALDRLPGPSVIVAHGGIIRGTRHLVEGLDGPAVMEGHVPQDNIYRFDGTTGGWLR